MLADMLPTAVFLAGPGQPGPLGHLLDPDQPAPDLGLLGLENFYLPVSEPEDARLPASRLPDNRPLAYSALLREMLGWLDQVRVYRLYKDIFGEDVSDCPDRAMVEVDFLGRVHVELFEFDLDAMLNLIWQDEMVLVAYYIPLTGYRIAWETGYMEDFPPYQQLLALLVYMHQRDDNWIMDDDRPTGYYGDLDLPHLDWLVATADGEPDHALRDQVRPHLERLSNLPAPFNALADLITGALDLSDNLFMSIIDAEFRCEYEYPLEFSWIPPHICWLADEYKRALPAIARIRVFEAWYEDQDEDWASQAIIAALTGEDVTPWMEGVMGVPEVAL